jgi:hypothetical protein
LLDQFTFCRQHGAIREGTIQYLFPEHRGEHIARLWNVNDT